MAAIGPDFKTRFLDPMPMGNADLTPTIAHVLGLELPHVGTLMGRVLNEALVNGPEPASTRGQTLRSAAADGRQTLLLFQETDGLRYQDAGCLVNAATPQSACR